jgi:hypothetical protein
MAAKMPHARVSKPPAPVADLPMGETSYITFTEVLVDEKDLSTYIKPDAKLRANAFNTVRIKREEAGYHINIGSPEIDYTPRKIEDRSRLLPIVEITRCDSAIVSSCGPICNTALALFAPWCSCTRNMFAG